MGITKTEGFSTEQNELAGIAKALGHPARIAIMQYLMSVDTCICGDIVNVLPLAQPTISQHLKELKNAGLINGNVEGNAICYCVNRETVAAFLEAMSLFKSKKKFKYLCC
jgi:ArsR family transcriptional regulator, arsenate/arsenite/antimonite-responsive transcriptional repressor